MATSQQEDIAAAGALGVNWDPFQREVLAELGLIVYRQAGAPRANADEQIQDAVVIDTPAGDSLMLDNVARAARMSTESLQACIEDMQVIVSLRGNASAKRAFWPRLRAMRKQHRG